VDIDEDTLNINPEKIEAAITPNTSAILATHCFGNPCDIDAIQEIADKYRLKVIYDAAHCFGTKYKGKSVFDYGDISTASFHATKIFHTIEGGAVFARDPGLLKKMAFMRNFGHDGPERFNGIGINGKNSEFHAAMGLCMLDSVNNLLEKRSGQVLIYDETLNNLDLKRPINQTGSEQNNAYYAVICQNEVDLLKVKNGLERHEIFPRRYFYPLLSDLDYVSQYETPIAERISKQILCLPLYHSLSEQEQKLIARLITTSIERKKY
jgi:dTDP-4-amino-4,6-dideoxygalactose transaminase